MRIQSGSLDVSNYVSSVFQKNEVNKAVVRSSKPKKDINKKAVFLEISGDMVRDSEDQFSAQFDKYRDMYT
tara:strand:- start:368 stop:580 length:213 start_codon:yes stop_codon:yes gene_type:complete